MTERRETNRDDDAVYKEVGGVPTDRSWVEVASVSGIAAIPKEKLIGMKILDLGSGVKIQDTPEEVFPGAELHAIDPRFSVDGYHPATDHFNDEKVASDEEATGISLRITAEKNNAHVRKVALAKDIPYPDNFFDISFSTFASPMHSKEDEQFDEFLEMLRVTKKEGEVRVAPVSKDYADAVLKIIQTTAFSRFTYSESTRLLIVMK